MVYPPSAIQSTPVTNPASSLARKAMTEAISSGLPKRPKGWSARKLFMP